MRSFVWIMLGIGLTALTLGPAAAQDEKTPTIKEAMDKLHKGGNSLLASIGKQFNAQPTPWTRIQKSTKDVVILGAALAKNEPPRGDKESWQRLANAYFTNAKAMDDAAQAQDLAQTKAARGRLARSCKACHDAHKGD